MKNIIKNNWLFLISLPVIIIMGFALSIYTAISSVVIIGFCILSLILIYITKNPFIGAILLILTLPFERIPTLNMGFATIKINQFIAGFMIVSWILQETFSHKKSKPSPYPIGWIVLLFIFSSFVSTYLAIDTKRAIQVFIFTTFVALASFVFTRVVNDKTKLKIIIKYLFAITFFTCCFAFYQLLADMAGLPHTLTGLKDIYTKAVLGFPRVHAFSMEPLYFANFLFLPLGLSLSYIFFKQYIIKGWKLYLLVLFILICIVLGISRGAYFGLAGMGLFFVIFLAKKVISIKNIIIFFLVTFTIILFSYIYLANTNPDAVDKFIEHATLGDFEKGESVQKRLQDYERAYNYWQEKPIFGIGPGNFGPRYLNYPSHESITDWEIVNNQYLEILTEWGIVGSVIFLIFIYFISTRTLFAYKVVKDPFIKATLFGTIAAFVAILIQYNFFSTIYIMYIWVFIGFLIIVQNLCFYDKKD